MKIVYNGHASFSVTENNFTVSVDPWVNSAFFGSWHPFPDNSFRVPELLKSDAILMSHEHEDHCDIDFLKQYKGEIYIPKYRSDSFVMKLSAHGIPFTEVTPRTRKQVGPFSIEFVIQSAPAWDDAAVIISKDDFSFVNLNDLKPSVDDIEYIKKAYKTPSLLAYQYSGASWHPMVYDALSDQEKAEIAQRKILHKFKNTIRLINEFKPAYILPSAGPPCFLYDELIGYNNGHNAVFPALREYADFLEKENVEARPVFMEPGDELNYQLGNYLIGAKLLNTESLVDRESHIRELKAKRQIGGYFEPAIKEKIASDEEITGYFNRIFENTHPYKNLIRYIIQYDVISAERTLSLFVNYRKNHVSFGSNSTDLSVGYRFALPSSLFNSIVRFECSWEEVFLSVQFKAWRELPQHDENAFTLHKFCHTEYLQQYFTYYRDSFRNETFEREHEGKVFRIQKFCPHAMGDLSKGEIVDGHIVCPSHGWAFCLKDGSTKNGNYTIKVEEVKQRSGE